MPTMGSPRPRETLAMTSGSSWKVVACTIAAARCAGSPDLKMPEPTNTPSAPSCIIIAASAGVAGLKEAGAHDPALGAELHHHRRVGRGGDAAGGEQDDGQLAQPRHLDHQ